MFEFNRLDTVWFYQKKDVFRPCKRVGNVFFSSGDFSENLSKIQSTPLKFFSQSIILNLYKIFNFFSDFFKKRNTL